MNKDLIPAAQNFEATHGRISDFLLRLDRDPSTDCWTYQMVWACSPAICPPELNKVISSPETYKNATLCRDAAIKQARKLSDEQFDRYLASKTTR